MKCFSCGEHGHKRNALPQKKSEGQGGAKEQEVVNVWGRANKVERQYT